MTTLFGKRSRRKRPRLSDNNDGNNNNRNHLHRNLLHDDDSNGMILHLTAVDNNGKTLVVGNHNNDHLPTSFSFSSFSSFADLGLAEPLIQTCRSLGFQRPTPVQRAVIPFLLQHNINKNLPPHGNSPHHHHHSQSQSPSQLQQQRSHLLALASTGSGKTAAFVLPILQHLSRDPYGIYAVILTPTRELAQQIHQQVLALGSSSSSSLCAVQSVLVVGGVDATRQSCLLEQQRPHFCVATPGRLHALMQGPHPRPRLHQARFLVLDEADRLFMTLSSGFERPVAELLLHCTRHNTEGCQVLLFSATLPPHLEHSWQDMIRTAEGCSSASGSGGRGRISLPFCTIVAENEDVETNRTPEATQSDESLQEKEPPLLHPAKEDDSYCSKDDSAMVIPSSKMQIPSSKTPCCSFPAGLKQEYIFMPSRVRDTYLLTILRILLVNGGREVTSFTTTSANALHGDDTTTYNIATPQQVRSAMVFVSSCERAAYIAELLNQVGVKNVALHSLLSQNRRYASLGAFKSYHVRVLVATDIAARGLDIPHVDLVINAELPQSPIAYVHRVGRTARAGRRGRAISLVSESDIGLVHAAERVSGRPLDKCLDVTDEQALKLLGSVVKAARLTKLKLQDIGFDELLAKFKERKVRDRKERARMDRALRRGYMGNENSTGSSSKTNDA